MSHAKNISEGLPFVPPALTEILNQCENISTNFARQVRKLLTSKDVHARKKRRLR